jgi:hypothetical protein
MPTHIYTRDDIRNILGAAGFTTAIALHAGKRPPDEYAQGYHDGYHRALQTIAISFGLIAMPGDPELPLRALYRDAGQPGSVHA